MVSIRRHARNWFTYAAGGGLVLATILVAEHGKRKKVKNYETDPDQTTSTQTEPQSNATGKPKKPAKCGPRKQHDTNSGDGDGNASQKDAKRLIWRLSINEFLTLWLTIASLAVSYLTYRNAADTSDLKSAVANLTNLATEAHRQADELVIQNGIARSVLVASNRAWLDLKVEIISDLKPQIDGENITVRVSARNFGHSPALGAYLEMEFHANHLFEGTLGSALKKACRHGNTAALASLTKAGRVIVPGAPLIWDRSATASEDDIDDALRSIHGQFGGRPVVTTLPVMSVLICVTYMTPEDTEMHQTAITRDVYRKNTRSETGMAFLARGSLIPKSDLALSDFIPGDYAD